jgi:NADPH-dependent 2,4-dienoyl-CoA reductase/sulfur reductase-like enzyme
MDSRFDFLILGGGIAGITAAETIRSRDAAASVAVVGAEPWRPYSRVALADVVTGDKSGPELELRPPGHWPARGIELVTGRRAVAVDADAHEVAFDDGSRLGYGKLLIATGARPRRLDVPGADLLLSADGQGAVAGAAEASSPAVHYLREMDDALRLKDALVGGEPVLVYGSGFVALEMAVAAHERGANVTVAMRGPDFFHREVSTAGREAIALELVTHGLEVKPGVMVVSLKTEDGYASAEFSDGSELAVRQVLVGLGLEANVDFLEESGLLVGGQLKADEEMRVAPDIYAAGDVAVFPDVLSGRAHARATWQDALLQGRAAALNMLGGHERLTSVTGHAVACFDLPIAFLGDSACPDAMNVERDYSDGSSVRLFFKDNRLVGATCVGKFVERTAATKLMTDRRPIPADRLAELADPAMPLASLLG